MKKFFATIGAFLHNVFDNADQWLEVHVDKAIQVVNQIKAFVNDKGLDVLTQFIPGDLDAEALKFLRSIVAKAINDLELTATITGEKNFLKKLKLFIAYQRTKSSEVQKGNNLRLASRIAQNSAATAKNKKVKGHNVDALIGAKFAALAEGVDLSAVAIETAQESGQSFYNPLNGKFEEKPTYITAATNDAV